jgi:hypothetical protein
VAVSLDRYTKLPLPGLGPGCHHEAACLMALSALGDGPSAILLPTEENSRVRALFQPQAGCLEFKWQVPDPSLSRPSVLVGRWLALPLLCHSQTRPRSTAVSCSLTPRFMKASGQSRVNSVLS